MPVMRCRPLSWYVNASTDGWASQTAHLRPGLACVAGRERTREKDRLRVVYVSDRKSSERRVR